MVQVWDSFFLNDELDLLEYRLRELSGHVDHFVIVEGTRTFSGERKRLFFKENEHRFRDWRPKIHHVVAELDDVRHRTDSPGAGDADSVTAWDREEQQRRALGEALTRLVDADDLVLIGDVDELPRRELLPWLASELTYALRLAQDHALWYANLFDAVPWDNGTMACRPVHFQQHPMVANQLGHDRGGDWRIAYREPLLEAAGWHLSSLGGPSRVRSKIRSYSHQEHDRPAVTSSEHLERAMAMGVRMDGRALLRWVPVDELAPALQRLSESFPDLLSWSRPPTLFRRSAYCGFTWLRVNTNLSPQLVAFLDRHPTVVESLMSPLLAALHAALATRRRFRDDPAIWKETVPIRAPVPGR